MTVDVSTIRDPAAVAALISPLRRRVLRALKEAGSAASVADQIGIPRQKVNYHVRALESCGLLEHIGNRQKGNCTERIVRATAAHYLISPSVLGDLHASPDDVADRFSSTYLAAISARTIVEIEELREAAATAGKRLQTFSLEAGIRFASPADQASFLEALSNAVAGLVARYHDETAPGGRRFRLMLGAHPAPRHAASHADTPPPDAKRPPSNRRVSE